MFKPIIAVNQQFTCWQWFCATLCESNTKVMLRLALGFFIVAIIAAVLGFGGIAAGAAAIAKIVFYVFLGLLVLSLLGYLVRGA